MEIRDKRILDKIRSEARLVIGFVESLEYDTFVQDELTKRAVTQTLANIGELVRSLSDDVKLHYNRVPWTAIRKTRNVIVHEYDDVDYSIIWDVTITHLPNTVSEINAIETDLGDELFGVNEQRSNYVTILNAIEEADDNGV